VLPREPATFSNIDDEKSNDDVHVRWVEGTPVTSIT
jgi:hypothetical protein